MRGSYCSFVAIDVVMLGKGVPCQVEAELHSSGKKGIQAFGKDGAGHDTRVSQIAGGFNLA